MALRETGRILVEYEEVNDGEGCLFWIGAIIIAGMVLFAILKTLFEFFVIVMLPIILFIVAGIAVTYLVKRLVEYIKSRN
ncbi:MULTISPECIES: hypothetical protein [unclassified Staphylococcus]|uniref:hypothetical protein n=1 Tax=unclassified Staphylococcus TaxID=91994 RepID=UPI0021CEAC81|nr:MULTISPECIES: hypothetical protein [unclassified Staphylococcus]UXR78470.1 hypothetical protein MUA92_00730 [Staphylococcus sp. IVB6227]UXR82628.1 hypothetical protein MUA51_00700 [Staphylococcus sp. IVB6214]